MALRETGHPGEPLLERVDGYVTVPGDSMFKVAADGYTLEAVR
jgi:hypothetical protein